MSERLIDSLPAVEACLRTSRRWLLGFGFDGTLSSIVDNPDAASLGPSVRESLAALSAPSRQVLAILSGRDRADLERRVALPNIIYAGNHGLDIRGPGFSFVEPTAATNQVLMNNLAAVMKEKLQGIEGIYVENKQLSISVHYRMVGEGAQEEVRRLVHSVLANTDHPFLLVGGEKVFDIRPRTYWTKGSALEWIREQAGLKDAKILYIGDDATDEDAFRVCADGITIKVGFTKDTAATYHLDNQGEVPAFLDWLATRV
jgi:trehalose 6-phosphate phosphatase